MCEDTSSRCRVRWRSGLGVRWGITLAPPPPTATARGVLPVYQGNARTQTGARDADGPASVCGDARTQTHWWRAPPHKGLARLPCPAPAPRQVDDGAADDGARGPSRRRPRRLLVIADPRQAKGPPSPTPTGCGCPIGWGGCRCRSRLSPRPLGLDRQTPLPDRLRLPVAAASVAGAAPGRTLCGTRAGIVFVCGGGYCRGAEGRFCHWLISSPPHQLH